MTIPSALMFPHEWKAVEDNFPQLLGLSKQLAQQAQWFIELSEAQAKRIEFLEKDTEKSFSKSESHFQLREKQRKQSEMEVG